MEDDDDQRPRRSFSPSAAAMSKVPSWISVGFVIGLLVGLAWHPEPKPVPGPVKIVEVTRPAPAPTRLGTVEAIFEEWRGYAAWDDDDKSEVAVWNAGSGEFVEFYEVKRINRLFFFRNIPKLTRVLSARPVPKECPLRFTEPWSNVLGEGGLTRRLAPPPGLPRDLGRTEPPREIPLPPVPKIEPPALTAPPVGQPEKR